MLKGKGYRFSTAAACNGDTKPHTIIDESLAAVSVKNATIAPPNVSAKNESTTTAADASPTASVTKKAAVVSGSSTIIALNANYILSFATLAISISYMF